MKQADSGLDLMRRTLRSLYRLLLLVTLLLAATVDGRARWALGVLRTEADGARWIHGWCRLFLRAIGVQYDVSGPLPCASSGFTAVTSNHLSYLDILLYSAATPMVMVAKTEVRRWPLIGWLTAQAGTVYVDRGGRPETYPAVNRAMARAYRTGLPVLFFPEGTTTDGSAVLPFRRGLYHSILADKVRVETAAVTYSLDRGECDASVANDVCWWGDAEFVSHLYRLLGLKRVSAKLRFDPCAVEGEDRFSLALAGRRSVCGLVHEMLSEDRPGAGCFARDVASVSDARADAQMQTT